MDLSDEHREKVYNNIVVTMAKALKEGEISKAELMLISKSLFASYQTVKTHEQLMQYLDELASHWEIFSSIITMEKGEGIEEREQQTINQMQSLLKSNQVEEAVKKGEETLHE